MPRPTTAHQQEYNKQCVRPRTQCPIEQRLNQFLSRSNAPIVDVVVDPKIADKLRAHQRE